MTEKTKKRKKTTSEKEDSTVKVAKITQTGVVIGLVITAIIAPIALLIANKIINIAPTATPFSLPPTDETTPIVATTSISEPTATDDATLTPTITDTPTVITTPQGNGTMIAQITTNAYNGRAPLRATFRAGSSYVTFTDGSVETCEFAHVCSYTWDVREKNGAIIHGPELGGSEFSYEFSRRGEFIVVVYVCRGQACNYTSVSITTR